MFYIILLLGITFVVVIMGFILFMIMTVIEERQEARKNTRDGNNIVS